jgi:hypothetical protein
MSVDVVLPALAAIEDDIQIGTIPDVITAFAFDAPPNSISGSLPCFVNLFGESTIDMAQGGEDEKAIVVTETCAYIATLYVAGAGTGTPGEAFDKITPWITPAAQVFLAHPNIAVTNGQAVILMRYLGHGRARGDLVYGGQQYYGVEFRLQIVTRMKAIYASYE